jgi:hypothetical protein
MNQSHKKSLILLLAAFILFIFAPRMAVSAGQEEFSATMVVEADGATSTTKIYRAADKTRIETGAGDTGVAIARQDKGVAWLLVPSEKMYIEVPLNTIKTTALTLGSDTVIKRERIGKEAVEGRQAMKEKVTVKSPDGSKNVLYYWQAEGMAWPVKAASLDGSWSYTLKDIDAVKQDASLFEIPAGYQKMSGAEIPGDMEPPDEEGDL